MSSKTDAEAQFKDLAEAWEVLKDEQRRAEYDQLWQHRNDPQFGRQQHSREQSYSQQDFDDIFSSMFGQQAHQSRRQHAARGHDLEIEVAVFLEETLAEQTRTISYKLPVYNVYRNGQRKTPDLNNENPRRRQRGAYSPERPGERREKTAGRMATCGWLSTSLRIRCSILWAITWKSFCRSHRGKRRLAPK